MKKAIEIISYSLYSIVVFILIYFTIAFLLSNIGVNKGTLTPKDIDVVYLKTNGVHLDIVLKKENVDSIVLAQLDLSKEDKYVAFGWGDENFYLHTPTWNDLTFSTAFGALFLKSSTLIHLTKYKEKKASWVAVYLTIEELGKLKKYLMRSFDLKNNKIQKKGEGYSSNDSFYKAKGSYSLFKTCNTWVNQGFKESGLKSCVWTPFDFGVLDRYVTN